MSSPTGETPTRENIADDLPQQLARYLALELQSGGDDDPLDLFFRYLQLHFSRDDGTVLRCLRALKLPGSLLTVSYIVITTFVALVAAPPFLFTNIFRHWWRRNQAVRRVQIAPGSRLRGLADLLFSKRTYSTIFEPTLRDLQDEYFQALADHRPWKARVARLRGYSAFWSAFLAQLPVSLIKKIVDLWKLGQP